MPTNKNPNPNATSNLTGWSKGGSSTTLSATSSGARWVGGSSGTGRYVRITVPAANLNDYNYYRIGNLAVRRNSGTARLSKIDTSSSDNLGFTYTSSTYLGAFALTSSNFVTFGPFPHGLPATTGTNDLVILIYAEDNKPFDFYIKGVGVYANGDMPAPPDLDSSDSNFTYTQSANSLTASFTYTPGDEAVDSLTWQWGDGTSNTTVAGSTGAASHTFPAPGVYNVKLTATTRFGTDGGTATTSTTVDSYTSATKAVTVPIGTFTAGFNGQTDFLHIDVDSSSSVAPSLSPIDTYAWNWGDGTTTAANASKFASHDYAAGGTYNVTLTVKDNATNRTATTTKAFTVSAPPNPDNYFVTNKDLLAVDFYPSITDGTSYAWNFGDGGTSSVKTPNHVYSTPGTYTVTLTVNGTLTTSQAVTVIAKYETITSLMDALRLEVSIPRPAGTPFNLLKNPSGELGAWGWKTPTAGSTMIGSTTDNKVADRGIAGAKLIFSSSGSGTQTINSAVVRAVAGKYAAAQVQSPYVDGYYRMKVDALDAAGAVLGSSALTGYQQASATATVRTTPYLLPTGTAGARVVLYHYSNTSNGTPLAGKVFQFRRAMLATATTSAELTSLPYAEYDDWQDLIGPTSDISVTREALDVGSLAATVLDSTFDPATSGVIRPGQSIRLRAKTQDSSGNLQWASIFSGKVLNANVEYVGQKGAGALSPKKTRITISASDAITALSRVTEPRGVAKIDELPELLEGVEVPYEINGQTGQVPTAQIVAWNENASLIDQIAITRDTAGGYAYVDRDNVLQAREPAYMPTVAVGVVDEKAFSDVSAAFNTDQCMNDVTIKWLRYTPASGDQPASVEEITYGPYTDDASIDEWDRHPVTFTMQGVENPTTIASKAAAILAANAEPVRIISSVTMPIRYQEDLTPAKALLDLYDLVHLAYERTDTDTEARVTSISHKITPKGWRMSLGFSADGAVASPQNVAAPPPAPQSGLPYAARRASAAQSIPNATATALQTDISDGSGGNLTFASNVFTVPRAGLYSVTCRVGWAGNATGARFLYIKRGSSYLARFAGTALASATGISGAMHVYCAAGDTIGVDVYQNSGAALNTDAGAGGCGYTVAFVGA